MDNPFISAANAIEQATSLIIATGAGMGVDSGLSTFRGRNNSIEQEVWPLIAQEQESPYAMSKERRFENEPHLAWGYFNHRAHAFEKVQPHDGYHILAKWMEKVPSFVMTSNIDNAWQQFVKDDCLYEVHGNYSRFQCFKNCTKKVWSFTQWPSFELDAEYTTNGMLRDIPKCIYCGEMARPNVFLIGDNHFCKAVRKEQYDRLVKFLTRKLSPDSVVIEIGCGKMIPTMREQCEGICDGTGAKLVRINLDDPEINFPGPHISIGGTSALDALQLIDGVLLSRQNTKPPLKKLKTSQFSQ